MKRRNNSQTLNGSMQPDAGNAAALLNGILATGNQGKFMQALRKLTEEFGGIGRFAEQAGFNRTQLYLTLSSRGNPDIRRLTAILRAMGMQLAVQPIKRPKARARKHAKSATARARA